MDFNKIRWKDGECSKEEPIKLGYIHIQGQGQMQEFLFKMPSSASNLFL